MPAIALMIAANVAADAPDRRADAYLFDLQLEILKQGLAPEGLTLEPVLWTDRQIDWRAYAAVLVNCAWDYQDAYQDFLALLDQVAGMGVPVFNPPQLVGWNIRKTYLRDLESCGVPVVPTIWPEYPRANDIYEAMAAFGTNDVILKRQVGGGARGQMRDTSSNLPTTSGLILDRPGMIQPFIPAITSEGELSFLFVDGEFSHAAVKRNATGDYRIQEVYGGRSAGLEAAPADRKAACAVLEALDEPPLYARVDMVGGDDGRLLLMELEVIEPF